jgi:hypothetical protein
MRKMYVSNVNKKGQQVGEGKWISLPSSIYHSNGFSFIEKYIERILNFKETHATLIIATENDDRSICMWIKENKFTLALFVDLEKESCREKEIREYFSHLNIDPYKDYLCSNGNSVNNMRCLYYYLPFQDLEFLTEVCKNILLCYAINKDAGLKFTIEKIGKDGDYQEKDR